MKTNTFLLMIAATFLALAGCSAGTTVITEEFDASICLEDPTVEGCDTIVEDEECASIWDPDCAGDIEDDTEYDDTEDDTTLETPDAKSFAVAPNDDYEAESRGTIELPVSIVGGTGKGPFTWTLEGETHGATLDVNDPDGREAAIIWTVPPTAAGRVQFTLSVSDKGSPEEPSKQVVRSVSVPDPVELTAYYKSGSMKDTAVALDKTSSNFYTANKVDMSDGARLMVVVKRVTGKYLFTSSSKAVKIFYTGCDDYNCYGEASRSAPGEDLTNVTFTVTNPATNDRSRLAIKTILMGGESAKPPENTAEFCKDGEDNDGDGKTDCADPDCTSMSFCAAEEISYAMCTDGIDNDGNGFADCDDENCLKNPYVKLECPNDDGPDDGAEDGSGNGSGDSSNGNTSSPVTISTAHIYIASRHDEGQHRWNGFKDTHHVTFCKDRDFKKCIGPIEVRNFETDGRYCEDKYLTPYCEENPTAQGCTKHMVCTYVGNLDAKLKGKDPKYLNYFKIWSSGEGSPFKKYKVYYSEKKGQGWESKIDEVKVQYNTNRDSFFMQPRTAYWNPCVNEWHQVTYYGCHSKCRYLHANETRFGKNDTAICAITYTSNDKNSDTNSGMSMTLPGVDFNKIRSATKYHTVFDENGKRLNERSWYVAPYLAEAPQRNDLTALHLDWGYKSKYKRCERCLHGIEYFWQDRSDLQKKQVESFGDHVFDCNPYSNDSCDKQRQDFDEEGKRPTFDREISVQMTGPTGMNAWKFGWYSAFVFQPGYVAEYDEFSGTENIDGDFIFSMTDDADAWVQGDSPFSPERKLKVSGDYWNADNFSGMGSCFYAVENEWSDTSCRSIVPEKNWYR